MNYDVLNDFLVKAMDFADSIAIKYKELKTMELSGLKESLLYKRACAELNNYIKEEKEFYDKSNITSDGADYLMAFLCNQENIDINQSFESLIHDNKRKFVSAFRVVFKLEKYITNDFQTIEIFVDKNELSNHLKFQKNLLINYCLVLESFVKRYINQNKSNDETLLQIKYLLSFINSDLEKEFCKNFDFKEKLMLDYSMIGDIFRMSREIQEQYIYLHFFNKIVEEINNLLMINDNNFDNKSDDILVSDIILKSLIMFFDDDVINALFNDLDDHISKNYIMFFNNRKIIGYILNLRESTKKDKANYSYLSLRFPK